MTYRIPLTGRLTIAPASTRDDTAVSCSNPTTAPHPLGQGALWAAMSRVDSAQFAGDAARTWAFWPAIMSGVPSALPAIESTDLAQVTRGREGRCEWSERTPPWSSETSCHLTVLPSRAVFGGEVPLGSRLSRRPTSCQSAVARNPSRRVGEDGFAVAGEAPKSLYRW
jgi:hypothetical protein